MEAVYYTLTGIILYVVSDWILDRIEVAYGRRFKSRSLIFFGILLALALASFWLIRRYLGE